jgi:hypothetical protein
MRGRKERKMAVGGSKTVNFEDDSGRGNSGNAAVAFWGSLTSNYNIA